MPSVEKPVILVVDPDSLNSTALAAVLHAKDYEVICAGNAEAALDAAGKHELDLVICETLVGVCDGLTVIQAIRELPGRNDVPVMFSSENQASDVVLKRFDAGNAYYIRKPYDTNLLLELVENALWMPALVQTHIHQPHAAIPAPTQRSSIAQQSTAAQQ